MTGRRKTRRPVDLTAAVAGRIRSVAAVLAILSLLLVGRLGQVQLVAADQWAARLDGQLASTVPLPATRGDIRDRTGTVLAATVAASTIYVDPRTFRAGGGDPFTAADQLAAILGLDPFEVHATLTADSSFAWLARQRDTAVGDAVSDLALTGVVVVDEPVRAYPAGLVAPGILGLLDADGIGITGLERTYQDDLAGHDGQLVTSIAPDGTPIPGQRDLTPPTAGSDLTVTLDTYLQATAQQVAADLAATNDADDASVVVLEVGTGRILAAATAPSAARRDVNGTVVRPITEQFEAGSVMKVVTVAAALDGGHVTATDRLPVEATIRYGGHTFSDSHRHPTEAWDVADIMERSSNVGTIMLADRVGAAGLHDMLRRFGVGTAPQLGLPAAAAGTLPDPQQWSATSLPTIAIGQGVALSAVQLADIYATIANGGLRVAPQLVQAIDGQPVATPAAEQVISRQTAATLTDALVEVIHGPDGTGHQAEIPGVTAAGKTGTARRPAADGGYADYVATFAGFAPAHDPQIAVVVTVDRPTAGSIYGGTVAAPAWSQMTDFALTYLQTGQGTPLTARH